MQNRRDMESSRTNPVSLRGCELIIIILTAGLVGVLSIYVGTHSATVPATNTISQQSGPFRLTLMEIMDTGWNSSMAAPQFSIFGVKGLEPAVNIRLPVHTLIQLTIISYDTPTPGSTDEQGKVTGTVGGTVYLVNGTTAMGTNVPHRGVKMLPRCPETCLRTHSRFSNLESIFLWWGATRR